MNTDKKLLDCGHFPTEHSNISTGYGTDKDGKTFCYACCAEQDKQFMRDNNKVMLYFTGTEVTNWPGSLRFTPTRIKTGKHNIARKRYDVWFRFEGQSWHGVQYGDMTQLLHSKKIK